MAWGNSLMLLLVLCPCLVAGHFPSEAPRFWPRYSKDRDVALLDGPAWEYGLHLDPTFDSLDPSFDPRASGLTPNRTAVPSCMDAVPPGFAGPRGVAMYRTTFELKASGAFRLQFLACSFYCRVYMDGAFVGEHRAGGYTPFWLDVPSSAQDVAKSRTRELFVLADNRFNSTTAPMHTGGDFWQYGGLMRSVVMHQLPPPNRLPWVWRAYVLPVVAHQGVVNLTLVLTKRFSGEYQFTVAFDGGPPSNISAHAVDGQLSVRQAVTERFGLRSWDVAKGTGRVTLNGEVVKLHGWNHHMQWPETGASPTDAQMDADLAHMVAAGTNFVRGAHYPQDPRWLDRMDEAGVAMWEETLGPATSVHGLTDWKHFMKYQMQQLDEMLDMSMNHASVMTWGWFNEGPSSDPKVCPAYAACSHRARSRDPTRFRTSASSTKLDDRCLEHSTLVAFNSYPGWYDYAGDATYPLRYWTDTAAEVRRRWPDKPFIASETGAGGIWEWSHNRTAAFWTTKFQTEVIRNDVRVALADSNISGITLWHYTDFKANDKDTKRCGPCDYVPGVYPPVCAFIDVHKCEGAYNTRPGGLNHKGVVDFWRRPKEAYSVVAELYNGQGKKG